MAKPTEKRTSETTKPQTPSGTLSRRALLQSVIAASAAAAFAPAKAASSTARDAARDQPRGLAHSETALLTRALDRLIPSDGVMPGAGEIGVAQFIDDLVVEAPHLRQPVVDILSSVGATNPASVSDEQMDAALRRAELEHPEAFGMLVHATYTGYYSHPGVLDAIGWVSPEASSNEPKYFDGSQLDDVRRRGPVYRHV